LFGDGVLISDTVQANAIAAQARTILQRV